MKHQTQSELAASGEKNICPQPNSVQHEALEWQVTLWSGEVTTQEQQAFEHWLQADPGHQQAWDTLQQLHAPLNKVSSQIASRVLRAPSVTTHRRKLLLGIAVLASVGVTSYGIRQTPQWQAATADYRTARGERRTVVLSDGTEVILNTASALDVVFTSTQRLLRLHRGELLITTGSDASQEILRPFIIETSAGQIRPIGTRFSVRQLEDDRQNVQVQVFEGAVQLSPQQGRSLVLSAGQQTRFNQQQVAGLKQTTEANTAWSRGLLIAERQRLDDFIHELARYRPGILRCDPAVAELIVSGVYPLKDTDAILQSLEQALPVRISSITGYWVTVTSP